MSGFQEYQRPNQSKLEPFRDEITEMRSKNWPLREIARWLMNEKQLKVGRETIRSFCRIRGIEKGRPSGQSRREIPVKGSQGAHETLEEKAPAKETPSREDQVKRLEAAKERVVKKAKKRRFEIDASKPLLLDGDDD